VENEMGFADSFLGKRFFLKMSCRAPVPHACNPSYLGGRDQEDRGSKPAPGGRGQFARSVSKNPNTKQSQQSDSSDRAQDPEFKPSTAKKINLNVFILIKTLP
jgi:hypothetical protein